MYLKNGTLLQGGTYRIVRFIKSGGFGCTYEAVHQLLNKRVAIKEFFVKDFCNREETGRITVGTLSKISLVDRLKQKFIAEASSLSALSHEGIVNVSNLFLENDTAYYVMDYIDGCSLDVYIQQNGPLAEAVALDYIGQACEALKFVHDKNILHLDVKPGNLMLDNDGKVTLIDFGTSKQYDECDGENTSTLLGNTPGYASPEQSNSKVTSFTPATDVYSLGATLYKLLTGITPPTSSERSSGEELDPLPEYISRPTVDAIMKAMILNKKERPQSVGEFQAMLVSENANVPPLVDDEDTVVEDEGDDDTVINEGDNHDNDDEKEPEPAPKKKSRRWLWWLLAALILVGVGVFAVMPSKSEGGEDVASTNVHAVPQHEIDKAAYDSLMTAASAVPLIDLDSCNEALRLYEEASSYEEKYKGNKEYSSSFARNASSALKRVESRIAELKEEQAKLDAEKAKADQAKKQYEADLKDYNAKIDEADKKASQQKYEDAMRLYKQAASMENKYKGNKEYSSSFARNASSKASEMQKKIDDPNTTGTHEGHAWVDLGLPSGLKWATCNVGASSPEEYGYYYAWGETRTKSGYWQSNSDSYRKSWGDIGGDSSRDAATANWGGSWRMPTEAEFQELIDNCDWTWTTQNGHKGYKVTSKRNGQSIFLPAAGYRVGDELCLDGEYGDYWGSTPNESNTGSACYLYFDGGGRDVDWNGRNGGRSLRPVLED